MQKSGFSMITFLFLLAYSLFLCSLDEQIVEAEEFAYNQ